MKRSILLALGIAVLPLSAQAEKDKKMPSMADMIPKPSAEMKQLSFMLGTWQVDEIHEPGFMGPGGKGHGTSHVTLGPGGLSLRHVYQSGKQGPFPNYHGEGTTAWDAENKVYKQAWVDMMMAGMMVSTGTWDGDKLVMSQEGKMGGKPFQSRDTLTKNPVGGFTMVSEMSMDGAPWAKTMTLVFKKAAK
jgi:Protein of unknown function (DUF1579)